LPLGFWISVRGFPNKPDAMRDPAHPFPVHWFRVSVQGSGLKSSLPMSSEYGTCKSVEAKFLPCLSGKSPQHVSVASSFGRGQLGSPENGRGNCGQPYTHHSMTTFGSTACVHILICIHIFIEETAPPPRGPQGLGHSPTVGS